MNKEFTQEQIDFIQSKLDSLILTDDCYNKESLFVLIDPKNVEQYQFNLYITKAIKDNKIVGYEIKTGRSGGLRKLRK